MATQQKLSTKSIRSHGRSVRLGRSRPVTARLEHLGCMTTTTPSETALGPVLTLSQLAGQLGVTVQTLFGWRYQAFVTNTEVGQLAFLEARHRAHARVEDRIRHAKDSGLGRFPSREFKINQTWLILTQIAADLTAWTRLLALTGDAKILATCEPKALRYRFLHVPARLTHGARRRRLRIPESWPWAIPQPS